jgi:hypothetical protein
VVAGRRPGLEGRLSGPDLIRSLPLRFRL